MCLSYGPALGPTLKKAFATLVHLVGRRTNTVYTYLNDQTVLFQTSQFRKNHLFALSLNIKVLCLNVKQFYLTDR